MRLTNVKGAAAWKDTRLSPETTTQVGDRPQRIRSATRGKPESSPARVFDVGEPTL